MIFEYIKFHRQEICFCLFIFFLIVSGSYIESWRLAQAFIAMGLSISSFVLGTLWNYKEGK